MLNNHTNEIDLYYDNLIKKLTKEKNLKALLNGEVKPNELF